MTRWLHELRHPQVSAYLERGDTILLPVGSVEQHGRHLPLMTDAAQAIAVAEAVAEATDVLVAPPIWYGWSPFHLCYSGSCTLRPETLASLVEDILNSLVYGGFKRIIILSGHTTMNFIPIDPVALRIRQNTGAYVATVDLGLIAKREISEVLRSSYDGHAGEWETSFMLHSYESFVDMGAAVANVAEPDRELFPALIPGDPRIDGNTYQLYPTVEEYAEAVKPGGGHSGDPTLATKEQGQIIFSAMVRNTSLVVERARAHSVSIHTRRIPI